MTEETKKTLVYGGVISLAVGVALYIYTRSASGGTDGGAAAAQAAQQAQAAQDETNLAMLAELGSSGASFGGVSLNSESTGAPPTPHDDLSHEIAAILNAAGLGGSPAPASTAPASNAPALPQPVVSTAQPAFATVPNHNNVLYARKVLA